MAEDVQSVQTGQDSLIQAIKVAGETPLQRAPNGIRYASFGETALDSGELDRIVQAVPVTIAADLGRKAYFFVPLAMAEPDTPPEPNAEPSPILIARTFTPELADAAICHRNVPLAAAAAGDDAPADGIFISTRLLNDRFALSFEFFINIGHALVECAGIPAPFVALLTEQALKDVRGETSLDAWDARAESRMQPSISLGDARPQTDEAARSKARTDFFEAAFADAIAIYLLSLSVDFNYSELREREYPLLAPAALAERLRLAARLFPPNHGYEFSIRYKKRA